MTATRPAFPSAFEVTSSTWTVDMPASEPTVASNQLSTSVSTSS